MQSVLLIAAGVSLLLSGILLLRFGLKKTLSNKIKYFFEKMTLTPWRGLMTGILAAVVMQSSTAVSLITIGLVSADYLTFYQSIGIILGANIGTCTTVQLLALSIPKDYLFPLLGLCLLTLLLTKRLRYIAIAAAGLTAMFLGLTILSQAIGELSQLNQILQYLVMAKDHPIYGILVGAIITMLFQSSSAATGILMVLAERSVIDITTAAYIVYGNNIGSCLSSVIVGAAAPIAAKRVAVANILLNIFGVLLFLPITNWLTLATAYLSPDFAEQVVLIHTFFNVISSLAVLPVIHYYAKLIIFLVPSRK
jgi:phosphate:Na+ symporter